MWRSPLRLRQPVSALGTSFSRRNALLLNAVARANGYDGDVWVSEQVAAALGLRLLPTAGPTVQLEADNGRCFYHHGSHFAEPVSDIQARARMHRGPWRPASASAAAGGKGDAAGHSQSTLSTTHTEPSPQVLVAAPSDTLPAQPLNTNGEPFPLEVVVQMMAYMERSQHRSTRGTHEKVAQGKPTGGCSPYWATPVEAAYIFQSPFDPAFLADPRNAVPVPDPLTASSQPLLYFHVSGTSRPAVFTSSVCCRYDPYNYCGAFYTPATAVRLKRYAVQHGCVHEARWLTPRRIRRHGVRLAPGTSPVGFPVGGRMLWLANIALTTNPRLLESTCLGVVGESAIREAEDSPLLLRCVETEEYDDAVVDDPEIR